MTCQAADAAWCRALSEFSTRSSTARCFTRRALLISARSPAASCARTRRERRRRRIDRCRASWPGARFDSYPLCAGNRVASPVNGEVGRSCSQITGRRSSRVLPNMRMKRPVRAISAARAENLQRRGLAEREGFEPSVPGKGYARLAVSPPSASDRAPARLFETQQGLMKYELLRQEIEQTPTESRRVSSSPGSFHQPGPT
jgi:hypothetical protein